jgi:hypothetical protein
MALLTWITMLMVVAGKALSASFIDKRGSRAQKICQKKAPGAERASILTGL